MMQWGAGGRTGGWGGESRKWSRRGKDAETGQSGEVKRSRSAPGLVAEPTMGPETCTEGSEVRREGKVLVKKN